MSELSTDKTCFVAFFPVEAPVYGGETIEVQFSKAVLLPAENNIFLVYEGEHVRHVTGVRKVNETCTLHAVIPANHREENLTLSAYLHEDGEKPRKIEGRDTFSFFYDSITYLALYLAEAIDNPGVIEDAETVKFNKFSLPPDLKTHQLDEKLATVFRTLDGIAGKGFSTYEEHGFTTLLHFAASLGLQQLTQHLLSLPGVEGALSVKNKNGLLAEDVAFQAGLEELASLMHRCRKEKVVVEVKNNRNLHNDVSITKTSLGTWNLTSSIDPQKSVVADIAMLKNTASLAVTEAAQRKRRLQMRSWPSVEKSVSTETHEVDQKQRAQMDSDQDQMRSGEAVNCQYNHAFTIPTINVTSHASRRGSLILEDSLTHLQDLTEGIQHLRDRNQRLLRVEGQGIHSRFSTSCPSLADVVNSSGGNQESNPECRDTDVKICVTEDGNKDVDDDSDTLKADEEWKLRRRSWCAISQHPPEKMQRSKLTRSMSLSSLDSNESASDMYHDASELPAASSQSGTSEYKTASSTSINSSMKPGRRGSVSDTALNILGSSSLHIPNSYSDDVDRGRRHSSHSVTSLGQIELEVPLDTPDGTEHRMRRKSAGAVVAGSREHLNKSSSDEDSRSTTLTKCISTPSLLNKTTSRTLSENLGSSRTKVTDRTGRPGTISEGIPPLPQMRRPRPSDSQGTPTHILIQRLTREYE